MLYLLFLVLLYLLIAFGPFGIDDGYNRDSHGCMIIIVMMMLIMMMLLLMMMMTMAMTMMMIIIAVFDGDDS
jgi:hypothetical protein